MTEAQFELLLAITLSVLLRPPAPSAARLTQIMVPTGAERDHVGIAMMIPTRHARFASLPERIRSTCVETVSENTMDEKRIARMFGLTLDGPFALSLILSAITIKVE